ncbi:uncharacterized protein LACBIDRAFT_303285 [Laccaria bicolor S238N-H82]|uniref:Predicted protein n=1 Tax=Laccaria bicolor (strain S238N-H82 / ATCC MYA-4686) TaxID=486041 RepID=B0DJ96_LACBS|nr:uncharacterized protein LACBIDRAFT_303285 [Laccaria bicolor S238N-H82]EDR05365.1 predicted protein [Laccaria bicolor S238N-H82]|eukprot:XP_001883923.1 predicted protein [Laccaria bicolor S238N-H82]
MRVTICLANLVSGIMRGSASRSFWYNWTITCLQRTGSSRQCVCWFIFVLQGYPGIVCRLAITNDIQPFNWNGFDYDGVSPLVSKKPSFSIPLCILNHNLVPRNGDSDSSSRIVETLNLLTLPEYRYDWWIIVRAIDIFPVSSSIKLKLRLLLELVEIVRPILFFLDRDILSFRVQAVEENHDSED